MIKVSNKVDAQQIYSELLKLRKEVEKVNQNTKKISEHEKRLNAIENYINDLEKNLKIFADNFQKIQSQILDFLNLFFGIFSK